MATSEDAEMAECVARDSGLNAMRTDPDDLATITAWHEQKEKGDASAKKEEVMESFADSVMGIGRLGRCGAGKRGGRICDGRSGGLFGGH